MRKRYDMIWKTLTFNAPITWWKIGFFGQRRRDGMNFIIHCSCSFRWCFEKFWIVSFWSVVFRFWFFKESDFVRRTRTRGKIEGIGFHVKSCVVSSFCGKFQHRFLETKESKTQSIEKKMGMREVVVTT
jgi:hypothetical protein